MIKNNIPVFGLLALLLPFITSCEQDDLGSMEFKFTGLRDTLVYQGSTTSRSVSIYYLGGEEEEVSLSASGMPNGVSIVFEPAVIPAGSSCLQRITATANADTGNYAITVTGKTESGGSFSRTFQLGVYRPINTPPKVFLTGNDTVFLELNSSYVEPGFSAGDEEDGDLTAQVQVSGTVNKDSVGIYKLTYAVTDSEGLTDQIVRNVNVKNNLNFLNGQYSVVTTNQLNTDTLNWITTISASVNTNNVFTIFKISDCFLANPDLSYNTQSGLITLASQTFTCITSTDTLAHTFVGSGNLIQLPGASLKIELNYTDSWLDPVSGNTVIVPKKDLYELF